MQSTNRPRLQVCGYWCNFTAYASVRNYFVPMSWTTGYIDQIQQFGGRFITDTCWCMLTEPVVPVGTDHLVTNSAKYAHYAYVPLLDWYSP